MYPFKYEVKSWDEDDKKIEELHGITFAQTIILKLCIK